MGRAPVSLGVYGSLEGGYAHQDGTDVIGHGIDTSGFGGPTADTYAAPDEGWFAGISVGYASHSALYSGLPFSRADVYFEFSDTDDSFSDTVVKPAETALKSVDGGARAVIGYYGATSIERKTSEAGVRFVADQVVDETKSLSWVVMPFIRYAEEETASTAIGTVDTAWRRADVDSWSAGVAFMVEPEVKLSSSVALVGRIGAGIYGYDADGNFKSDATEPVVFDAALSDGDSGVGFRGLLGGGIKVDLAPGVKLTGFIEADYFSDVAGAQLPDTQLGSATTSRVASEDVWELNTGLRLSFGLGQ